MSFILLVSFIRFFGTAGAEGGGANSSDSSPLAIFPFKFFSLYFALALFSTSSDRDVLQALNRVHLVLLPRAQRFERGSWR